MFVKCVGIGGIGSQPAAFMYGNDNGTLPSSWNSTKRYVN